MTATGPLYAAAGILALVGLAARILPIASLSVVRPDATVSAIANRAVTPMASDAGTSDGARDTAGVDPIVASNIFSRARVAPPRPRDADDTTGRRSTGLTRAPALPTLYGTTIGPAGSVAVIDPHGTPAGAQMYHVGDRIGNGRLAAIGDSTATLARPGGALVLQLRAMPRRSDHARPPAIGVSSATVAAPGPAPTPAPVAAPLAAPLAAPGVASVDPLVQRLRATFRRPQ